MYEYQYHELIKNNFRVIGITLRGFGKSDRPFGDYSYDTHVADIKKILAELNITDAVMGGFSMGGAIAIKFVTTSDNMHVSKLALFSAAAPIWTKRRNFPYNFPKSDINDLIHINYSDRPKLLTAFAKMFSFSEFSLNKGITDWLYGIGLSASPYAMGMCLMALRDTDLRDDLAKIKIPTLIMHGKKDKICSYDLAKLMLKGIKGSNLITFENCGHSIFLEETQKFNAELIKFASLDAI
jgi:pimeloyl-ACP methyl ester carboxylesterase